MSKERGIIVTTSEVRGLLDGTITGLRRKARCPNSHPYPEEWDLHGRPVHTSDGWVWDIGEFDLDFPCPYPVGTVLYLRETVAIEDNREHDDDPPFNDGRPILRHSDDVWGDWWEQPHYKATDPAPDLCCESDNCRQCERDGYGPHWISAARMPRRSYAPPGCPP